MYEKLKRFVPAPLWSVLKWPATVFGLRRPHVMLTPRDIEMLEKWGKGRRSLVEIGVFEGGSAVILRRVMHAEATLVLIDPYVTDSLSDMRGSYSTARYVVNRVRRGTVEFVRDYSYNAVKTWTRPLGFLFIDGDHHEDACRRDFEEWERYVQPNGVILFHDARLGQPSEQAWMGAEGPTNVVNRLFRHASSAAWRIVDEGGSIVVIQRS